MISINPIYNKVKEAYGDTFTLTNEELQKKLLEDGNYRVSMFDYLSKYDPTITTDINKWIDEHSGGSVAVGGEGNDLGKFTGFDQTTLPKEYNSGDEEIEEEEEEWNPNPNINYETLPLLDVERSKYEEWKTKKVKEEEAETTLTDQQNALIQQQLPPNTIGIIKTPPSPLLNLGTTTGLSSAILGDTLKATEKDESIFNINLFTPSDSSVDQDLLDYKEEVFGIEPKKVVDDKVSSGQGTKAQGLGLILKNNLPDGFEVYDSFVGEVTVTAPNGETHQIKSLLNHDGLKESPEKAQKDFIEFLNTQLLNQELAEAGGVTGMADKLTKYIAEGKTEAGLPVDEKNYTEEQKKTLKNVVAKAKARIEQETKANVDKKTKLIELTVAREEAEVAALFQDAPVFSSEAEENIYIKNGGTIEGGAFGLSTKERREIKERALLSNFDVVRDTKVAGGKYVTTVEKQENKEELEQAYLELTTEDKQNNIEREIPLISDRSVSIPGTSLSVTKEYSQAVKDKAISNIQIKMEADARSGKYEEFIEGDSENIGKFDRQLIRSYKTKLKVEASDKVIRSKAVVDYTRNKLAQTLDVGVTNLIELNEFTNNKAIVYNVNPGDKVYESSDGRFIPAALYDNAMAERDILTANRDSFNKSRDRFFRNAAAEFKEEKDFDIIKREYNDAIKFVNQFSVASADLIINVAYGAYKLVTLNSSATKMLGIDDPIDGAMLAWNGFKEEQASLMKKDVAFGDIDTLAEVGSYALQSAAQQLPIILSMIATGGISGAVAKGAGLTGKALTQVGRISSSTMIGLNSFGSKVGSMNYEEYVTGMDLYSDAEILLKGIGYGVVEGGLAYVSTAKSLGSQVNRVKGFNLEKAVVDQAEEEGRKLFIKRMLTAEILPETAVEMGAEGLTTGLQNMLDGRPFLENMNETLVSAGIWGAGMSGMSSVYSFGAKDFTSADNLRQIREATTDHNKYTQELSSLLYSINQLNGEGLKAAQPKIKQLIKLQQDAKSRMVDAMNQTDINIKKKGIDEEYAGLYISSITEAANIRAEALEIVNDPNIEPELKEKMIENLEGEYMQIKAAQKMFTDTNTFGSGWGALSAAAVRALPFSKTKKQYRKIKAEATQNIIDRRNQGSNPFMNSTSDITVEELNYEAESIMLNNKIEVNVKRDAAISSKLGLGFKSFDNNTETVEHINNEYDKLIKKLEVDKSKSGIDNKININEKISKLKGDRDIVISKIKKGTLNGYNDANLSETGVSIVSIENMKKNNRSTTGLHEITHSITNQLMIENPTAFNNMGKQIEHYLKYTNQGAVLIKMGIDNANLYNQDGTINSSELVSSFMEEISGGTINLEKMDNQVAVLGKLFTNALKNASEGKFDLKLGGETGIMSYFESFSKARKKGDITKPKGTVINLDADSKSGQPAMAASESGTNFSETNPTLYNRTEDVFNSDLTLDEKAFDIGQLWKNETTSRLRKGYRLGKQYLKPSSWDGWSDMVMEDIVSDMTTGGSGVPGLVKSWAKRGPKFKNISLANWINDKFNQRLTGYLPNDLVAGDLSIDSETARQIEDVKAGRFDESIDTKETPGTRQLESFEDLSIVTPELFDGIRKIVTDKLKRVAITKGFNQDTVNTEIQSSIEKEITKVIKAEMGPISKSALGFATKKYTDFIVTNMDQIIGAMPIDVIKQKAKSKAWSNIFKLTEIGREDIKKVDADGKTTNYRKQIFEVQKPDPNDFKKYFTRGGYTTLIARQKSLIQPIAKELAKTEIFKLKNDPDFLNEISKRTGMTEQEVSTMYIDNVLTNLQDVLDQTAGESRSQDTIKFSETLSSKSDTSKQALIDGMKTDTFRAMVAMNLANIDFLNKSGKTSAVRDAMENYFYPAKLFFEDITDREMKRIATDFSGPLKSTFQNQLKAEAKKSNEIELSNIIADSLINDIVNQNDYKKIELSLGIKEIDFDAKSLSSVNQGRSMALKVAQKIGRQEFLRLFAPGLSGPGGLSGLMVTTPSGNQISEAEFVGPLPTVGINGKATQAKEGGPTVYSGTKAQVKLMSEFLTFRGIEFNNKKGDLIIPEIKDKDGKIVTLSRINGFIKNGGRQGSGLFLNRPDLEQNVLNVRGKDGELLVKDSKGEIIEKNYDGRVIKKDWYKSKKWEALDGDKTAQLEYVNEIHDEGETNKKIFRSTIESLAGELTPTEARWLVHVSSADMAGALKSSASLIGYPTLNRTDLQQSLNLEANDGYILEHMTPAKYMALLTYKYLLDPSAKSKSDFNTELDNFHTIILPQGVDSILRAEGKQYSMGLKHRIGDDPFQTRYDEVLAIMEITKTDGSVIGNKTVNYSETFNDKGTQNFDSSLINSSEVKFSESDQNSGISVIEAELLDKALAIARDPNAPVKKIRVFDFDDTLARTNSNVLYTMPDGTTGKLTAEQFAKDGDAMLAEGAVWDFSEFNKVVDGKPGPLLDIAKKIQEARGTKDVFVLTARSQDSAQSIKMFLDEVGLDIPLENITGLGDSSPLAKSGWMVDKAAEGYNDFYFTDDHLGNIDAVDKVMSVIDVKSKTQQAKIKFSETVDQKMNDIIYQKTGIESFKEYSDVKAKAAGRNVKRFSLIPASAEDFGGLLYSFLGKGSEGDAQWQWMQDTLIKPYNRGVNDATIAQNTLTADFKALKNSLEGIPKNLKKVAFDGFTFEDIVRVTAWESQGIEVDGLSKRDLKNMRDFVAENPELGTFAEQIVALTKSDGYYYPGKNWLAGTITTDFREGLRVNTRSRYLKEWNENIDQAFSTKNLNKIEAAYGANFREALENSIYRMKTGTNRSNTMGKLESRVLDYINNSVGTVMFLNSRSAILQTISAINFMNWSDNNPLKAGKAFANQPQFWKDFMFLMNSDYLVDRRNGLKINVSDSEISEAAKTSKNKAKGVISTLLSKGFVLTQFADSFAIASGGATFYRNRFDTYKKQGLSDKEASKKAFEDFKSTAETSQQSSDPSKISSQQASTLGKVLLAFANTPSQYSRIMKKSALDLVNGRGDWKENISKIVYYGAIQNVIFTTLQSALFALAFSDDDEEGALEEKSLTAANSMVDNVLRGLGIGGTIVSTVKNLAIEIYDRSNRKRPEYGDAAWKMLDFAPPIDIKVSKFRSGLMEWDYNKDSPEANDPFDINNPAYGAMAKIVASTTNIPLDRLVQKLRNVQGAVDSDNQNWQRIAMLLGWPKWQLEPYSKPTKYKQEERSYSYKDLLKSKEDIDVFDKEQNKIKTKAANKLFKDEHPVLYDMDKNSQDKKLKELGVSPGKIASLKSEKERVELIVKLQEDPEYKVKEDESIDKLNFKLKNKKYFKLTKIEQVAKLDSLGLTKKQIRALTSEADRVKKLLELMEE